MIHLMGLKKWMATNKKTLLGHCFPHTVVLLIAAAIPTDLKALDALAPKDAGAALLTMWQVQASFTGVAFAVLALIFQFAEAPDGMPRSMRDVLYERTRLIPILIFSGTATLIIGAISIWRPTDGAVAVAFFLELVPSVAAIVYAYKQSADIFRSPDLARALATKRLESTLIESLRQIARFDEANKRLAEVLPQDQDWPAMIRNAQGDTRVHYLVRADRDRWIEHIDPTAVDRLFRTFQTLIAPMAQSLPAETLGPTEEDNGFRGAAILSVQRGVGSTIREGISLFRLSVRGHEPSADAIRQLEIGLEGSVTWHED